MTALFLLLADVALVVLFAAAGNRSHETGLSPADIASTAWPFLAGLLIGWLVTRSWRRPSRIWPQGAVVLLVTVALGMLFRTLFTDGGTQISFVLVATGTLGVLLLSRRLLSALVLPHTKS